MNIFYWLAKWRRYSTSTISEVMSLLYQTWNTKCYQQHLKEEGFSAEIPDTLCPLCNGGHESVMHLMSNCGELAKKIYKDRHDLALKCFYFHLLVKFGFKLLVYTDLWQGAEYVYQQQSTHSRK